MKNIAFAALLGVSMTPMLCAGHEHSGFGNEQGRHRIGVESAFVGRVGASTLGNVVKSEDEGGSRRSQHELAALDCHLWLVLEQKLGLGGVSA